MMTTNALPILDEPNRRLFVMQCDCCGLEYDADLRIAIPFKLDRLLWLCPHCGCPSNTVIKSGIPF
jgi:rubredoxin